LLSRASCRWLMAGSYRPKKKNPEYAPDPSFLASGPHAILAKFACRILAYQPALGPDAGLATSRKDRSTPRDSRLALVLSSALAAQPLAMNCSWPRSCAMGASLRPRCRSRASRFLLRLRAEESSLLHCQNLENCQGTSVFLLLLFSKSTKFSRLYLMCFQSSAARPQARARIWCSRFRRDFRPPRSRNICAAFTQSSHQWTANSSCNRFVGNQAKARPERL